MIQWLGGNKLVVGLGIIVVFLLLRRNISPLSVLNRAGTGGGVLMKEDVVGSQGTFLAKRDAAPVETAERMVVQDTYLSLLVDEAGEIIAKIELEAVKLGGFLVDSSLNKPEGAASGSITVRVLSEKRQEALEKFRGLGTKVISERVMGRDVTDEYVDLEARLAVLKRTKAKFEEILEKGTTVQDLLSVQRELSNLQRQIDNLKGQQKYLEQTAKLTKITVYLATDELALPYTPDKAWRPKVVFKRAVRSLVANLRLAGSGLIWVGVYAPIWLGGLAVIWLVKRGRRQT